jgi:REP element-mobilizing transposase RayT
MDLVMEMKTELPQRKHPRLDNYDYSSAGAYFITICTQNRQCVLSHIVGRGLAPAETIEIEYTLFGTIAEKQLLLLKKRYPFLTVDKYVIMPNHIHIILILNDDTAGASPRPTITDIVCSYKSLTTRECKKKGFDGKLFQTSFYEHIIRGREDYEEIVKYVYENPIRWRCDELYVDDISI